MSRRLRFPGRRTLATAWRWLRSRGTRGGLILLYHRVSPEAGDPRRDPWGLGVRPETFAAHLDWLADHARVLSLAELDTLRRADELPPRAVAITFDDGYRDNLTRALPALLERRLPATFFLVAGIPGEVFWWDRLAAAVLSPGPLAGVLRHHFGLSETAGAPPARRRLLDRLHGALRDDPAARRRVLEALEGTVDMVDATAERRCLEVDEMCQLAAGPGVEIGSHSLSHPSLATLGESAQQQEISDSRQALERRLGVAVTSFSYPYGTADDWSRRTLGLVRASGYDRAVTNLPDLAGSRSPAHALPRLWIDDQSVAALARHLHRWWGI